VESQFILLKEGSHWDLTGIHTASSVKNVGKFSIQGSMQSIKVYPTATYPVMEHFLVQNFLDMDLQWNLIEVLDKDLIASSEFKPNSKIRSKNTTGIT